MGRLFIPTLSHWQNKNIWSGSLGAGNYYITPQEEVDGVPTRLRVQVWGGKLCYELASPETEESFPLSEEGLAQLERWLEGALAALSEGAM